MALILEVRDQNGVATLHRLNSLTMSIGRALSNDIILDDPYVDARHARIAVSETGALELHDTGSVNGLYVDNVRAKATVPIQAGVAVRVGRTTLRFRDVNEEVAPALVEAQALLPARTMQRTLVPAGKWQWAVFGGTSVLLLVNSWLGSTGRDGWTPAVSGLLAIFVMASLWAVIWGATTRGADRRLNFVRHLAITTTAVLLMFLLFNTETWTAFFFPGSEAFKAFAVITFILILTAWIAEHLAVSTLLSAKKRWRAGAIVSGFFILITVLAYNSRNANKTYDEPSIDTSLKPLSDRIVPATTVPKFVQELSDLQKEVDKLLDEQSGAD
jgi:hypothetical protein